MKQIRTALCWILLAGLLVSAYWIYKNEPIYAARAPLLAGDDWSGVLRVWTHTGWQSGGGSLTPWLNACATLFEKRNKGVRIQIQSVSESALRDFADGSANPPDAVLFAPGLLKDESHLLALAPSATLLPALSGADGGRAVPVAMGGYAWAYNRTLLPDGIPADWSAAERPTVKKKQAYLMQANRDQPYVNWSRALLSLCSGVTYIKEETATDIGLIVPTADPLLPSPTPIVTRCRLPAELPSNFRATDEAYTEFINGTVAAIPVTQKELRRLRVLSENGRGPDYAVAASGTPFTDQLALYAVVDIPRADLADRQRLCYKFLTLLLSDEAQQDLSDVLAFRTTRGAYLYGAQKHMSVLEGTLFSNALVVPGAFDRAWRDEAAASPFFSEKSVAS